MKVLVVEDDEAMALAMARALRARGAEVLVVGDLHGGLAALQGRYDLIIVDVCLPDGSGVELARTAASASPSPTVIAVSGKASATDAFELARIGVRGYLSKPISLDTFDREVTRLMGHFPLIATQAAGNVGHRGLHDVQLELRKSMLRQALALSDGNKTAAARMLGLTRQAVQAMLRDINLDDNEGDG
jgi:two-component system response regulator RegA